MKLTRRQALTNCKKMYEFIAGMKDEKLGRCGSTIALKSHVTNKLWPNESIKDKCWACQYQDTYDRYYCNSSCIISWGDGDGGCISAENSQYGKFKYALYHRNFPEVRKQARAIVNLCDNALAKLKPLKKKG